MTIIQKIENFILNNDLRFTEGRRNSDCTILAGFILSIKSDYEADEILDIVSEIQHPTADGNYFHDSIFTDELNDEFERVWEFAKNNNYGAWWSTEEAKKQYKF